MPTVSDPNTVTLTTPHSGFGSDTSGASNHVANDHAAGEPHHSSPWRQLKYWLWPETRDIAAVALFAGVISILSLATPITVETLVNTVAFGRLLQPLIVLSLILLLCLTLVAILRLWQAQISELLQQRLFVRVMTDLAAKLPRVKHSAWDGQYPPDVMNRVFEVVTLQKGASELVLEGTAFALQMVISLVVLALYHPYLFGFDVILLCGLGLIVTLLGRGGVYTAIKESKTKYAVVTWFEEFLNCPCSFRNRSGEAAMYSRADNLVLDYVSMRQKHFRVLFRQMAFTLGLQALAGSLLLGLGGWLVLEGQLTLGQLVAAELIIATLLSSFSKLGKHLEALYDLLAAVDKLGYLLELPTMVDQGYALERKSTGMTVSIHGVSHRFPDQMPAPQSLFLRLSPGELVALMGPPSSGKSTVLDMLFGVRAPDAGEIEFDGHDIRLLHPLDLRDQVALVRNVEIFTGTVLENIHLGREGITLPVITQVLRELDLYAELQRLPQGLETLLNPAVRPLSDSLALRLMLARALVAQPRLLLLDGGLDHLPENLLHSTMAILKNTAKRCTLLIVTHRSAVADQCDRLIRLEPHEPVVTSIRLGGIGP